MEEIYMKRKEFAEHLKISRSTVDKLIKEDGFPLLQVLGQYRIPLNQAVVWMNERIRKGSK